MNDFPNIVLIMTDNQPADMLGSYGNEEIYTPNLDRMAAQGLQFENAYCPNAMCSPSRASLWTGRLPCQHGIHTWLDDRLVNTWPEDWNAVEEFDTLPEIFKRNGYVTAMIGKYHLGKLDKPQNGIDHWITMARGHTLDFYGNTMRVNEKTFIYEGHSVDFFSAQAVDYIKEQSKTPASPFFLILPFNGPYGHWPSIKGPAKNEFWERYIETPMCSIPREGICKESIECYELNKSYHSHEEGGPDFSALIQIPNDLTSLRNYFSQVSVIDKGVGNILNALKNTGLEKETIVIFTSDHGFSLGHHGFWGHGQATWPSNGYRIAYNIPMIFWGPEFIKAKEVRSEYVSSLDLYSTLLEFLGISGEIDKDRLPSRNFSHILRGEQSEWENGIFIEQEESRAYRTEGWTYIKRFHGSNNYTLYDELYDTTKDPEERHNLSGASSQRIIEEEFSTKLDTYFKNYADPKYDVWAGGRVKSNTSRPWLWKDVWGEEWKPIH